MGRIGDRLFIIMVLTTRQQMKRTSSERVDATEGDGACATEADAATERDRQLVVVAVVRGRGAWLERATIRA